MLEPRSSDISLRQIARNLLRRREDPYAADDLYLARRISGLVAILTALLTLVFLPLAPPREIAGWVVAAVILLGTLNGAWRLFDTRRTVTWDQIYALSYLGIAAVAGLTWASGGAAAYTALYAVAGAGSSLNPPRRAVAFLATAVAAALAPLAFGADPAVLVPMTLGWATVCGLIVVGSDALRQQSLELADAAHADALTGLGNRRAFDEALGTELARARRAPAPLSIALFDLDGLKRINDRHGHLEGDSCLRQVATALRLSVRGGDLVFRWAGDEFAALFPNTGAADAKAVAERVRSNVAASAQTSVGEPLIVSYGVAQQFDDDPESLVRAADVALFGNKAARPVPANPSR
jgi:diguanylate cyclase (GGDEF)-like protein